MKQNQIASFPELALHIEEKTTTFDNIKHTCLEHLTSVENELKRKRYILQINLENYAWFRSPFTVNIKK